MFPIRFILASLFLAALTVTAAQSAPPPISRPPDPNQRLERTCFQTGAPWSPRLQLGSDLALCYGVGPDIAQRLSEWRMQGYRVGVMTGVSWGNYQDYLYGKYDGVSHVDEAQTDRYGHTIGHGGDVYYMCPGKDYGNYLCVGVQRALDGGASSIFLEEPEFWVRAGYSAGFKREWQDYFHTPWIPPYSSPDAQYKASELKYYLFRRALSQIFAYVHAYNRRTGRHVKCYVPTHSLINYAHWGIVSPESSLRDVGADGYICQTWTGTARTPNVYEGKEKERTFETAFCEYGAMMTVVHSGGGKLWFLNDPVEDNPDHSWEDYRANWESTLTASLLWPQIWRYEVMPWPERVWTGTYPTLPASERKAGQPVQRAPIPQDYATELLTVLNSLNDMRQKQVTWDCGTQRLGVMVSDTMMFQRGDPVSSDPNLGSFFGMSLPLIKHGMPAAPVSLETCIRPGALEAYRVLLMTYEGMKPMDPQVHAALVKWVKMGGVLVFIDNDSDPYNSIHSWWNSGGLHYATPRQALFASLGVPDHHKAVVKQQPASSAREWKIGRGALIWWQQSPAALSYMENGAKQVLSIVQRACKLAGLAYRATNYIALRRGPYLIAAGLSESRPAPAYVIKGRFLNLFDPKLTVLYEVSLSPGTRWTLLDLNRLPGKEPKVAAASCRVLGVKTSKHAIKFWTEGPQGTEANACIVLPESPRKALIDGLAAPAESMNWDESNHLLHLRFPNGAAGKWVTVEF